VSLLCVAGVSAAGGGGAARGTLGRSNARDEVGIFAAGADTCAARGRFVHVYVDRVSRRPVPALPAALRRVLEALQ